MVYIYVQIDRGILFCKWFSSRKGQPVSQAEPLLTQATYSRSLQLYAQEVLEE